MSSTTASIGPRALAAFALIVAAALPASAQQPPVAPPESRPWQFEIYGGGLISSRSGFGQVFDPPAPEEFTTFNGRPSAYVPSWYFGYGALLLGAVTTALNTGPAILGLDRTLLRPMMERTHGWHGGVRLRRVLNRHWAFEVAGGYAGSGTQLSDDALRGIETARSEFIAAWQAFMSRTPNTNVVITSEAAIDQGSTRQLLLSGALQFQFRTSGRFRPYATVGGGLASTFGDLPRASITGRYRFLADGVVPIDETDSVTMRFDFPRHAPVVVIGAGVTMERSSSVGVRADLRAHIMGNSIANLIDASPQRVAGPTPGVTATDTYLSVQHGTGGWTSSLGPGVSGVQLFKGGGNLAQVGLTAGVFWRF